MTGRLCLLAAVAGTAVVQGLPQLPGTRALFALLLGLAGAFLLLHSLSPTLWRTGWLQNLYQNWHKRWHGYAVKFMLVLSIGTLAFCITVLRAQHRLDDHLAATNENKVSRVVLRIASLVTKDPDSRRFEADVLSSKPAGVPTRIQVSWHSGKWGGPYGRFRGEPASFPELAPGQVWRMALTLKSPHGARNPYGFDYEGYLFAKGVRATGSVRGKPRFIRDEPWANLPTVAQRARHRVRQAMLPYLDGKRYGAVLLALAIGDQNSVPAQDWQVFNLTGITHLVSISGSHITMIAALGAIVVLWLWPRIHFRGRALAERIPAQVASAVVAVTIAWLYCLLAGWGVPARRTFVMLLVLACARVLRFPMNTSRALCLVVFAVVVLDPWSLLSSGFWLSFGAVYVLLASAGWLGHATVTTSQSKWQRVKHYMVVAAKLQLAITIGLVPILALIFHQVSLVSPVVNAYAIPVIGLVVTPLSLLAAATSFVPALQGLTVGIVWLAHHAMLWTMAPTVWLSGLGWASMTAPAAPWAVTLLAIGGICLAVAPFGFPGRSVAWLLVMPALFWRADKPEPGGWHMAALDVGQAGAVVIRTANHAVLFDTGLRSGPDSDEGARTLVPYMWAKGIRRLDVLVVSHADIDHAGGARSVLSAIPVEQSYSSFNLATYLKREARLLGTPEDLAPMPLAMSRCEAGVSWMVDGVFFKFVWPLKDAQLKSAKPPRKRRARRNGNGCVLLVRGAYHSTLLTGDVGVRQERYLVDHGVADVDVVMAGHHGSKTSSGTALVNAVDAKHVIAQVGKWNRYKHPSPMVQKRWERAGATFWRTDRHGALQVASGQQGLSVMAARQQRRRYWHSQPVRGL